MGKEQEQEGTEEETLMAAVVVVVCCVLSIISPAACGLVSELGQRLDVTRRGDLSSNSSMRVRVRVRAMG